MGEKKQTLHVVLLCSLMTEEAALARVPELGDYKSSTASGII